MGVSNPKAGAFVTAVPSGPLLLRSREFSVILGFRLGLALTGEDPSQCPCCAAQLDQFGFHAVACQNGQIAIRHSAIKSCLAALFRQAGFSVQLECAVAPGSARRPADLLVPLLFPGVDGALDTTVVSPLLLSNASRAARERGAAASAAEARKIREYASEWAKIPAEVTEGIQFVPMALECTGGWGSLAVPILRKIALAITRSSSSYGMCYSESCGMVYQRLSVALVRHVARQIICRKPAPAGAL